jgi:AcrR family transcriptional regulator
VHDREPLAVPFAGWWSSSAIPDFGPYLRREHTRERLIDVTLDLCAVFGYDATTIDQIAAVANIAPDRFVHHFETKDAVLMAVLDDVLQAIAAAFDHLGADMNPEHALLAATIDVLAAVNDGCGVTTVDRLAIAERMGDDQLAERMTADLAAVFVEVTRELPTANLRRIASFN